MIAQEYTDLIDYLFNKLRDIQLNDIAEEINTRINRGKTVTLKDATDLKEKNIKQQEVGKTQTLPLTPKEAFEIAVDHLSKVIVEVPSYAKRITAAFGNNVVWESDQTHSLKSLNTTANSFSLNDFTFDNSEINEASDLITLLKSFIKES